MDNLLKNFAEFVNTLGKQSVKTEINVIDGKSYASGTELKQIWPDALPPEQPLLTPFVVGTLSAAIDLVVADLEHITPADLLIHVVSHGEVNIVLKNSDEWKRRQKLIEVKLPPYTGFQFNKYMAHEDFVIALQQNFIPVSNAIPVGGTVEVESDFNYLSRISATITASAVTLSENDGIAQQVSVKRNVSSGMKEIAELRRTVLLAPFRTFMEVPQPASTFLFRVKDMGEGNIPQMALFEVDGGMWRKLAVGSIHQYLKDKMNETKPILQIPIVS